MTREELKALGLNDEQIEKVIVDNAKGIQAEKAKAEKFKADAKKAEELQKQLDEINAKGLSDLEKEKKAREAAEQQAADLQKQLNQSAIESIFAKAGLSGEEYAGMVGALSAMDMESAKASAEAFVGGISKRDGANKTAWEKEIFNKTPNPGGSGGDPGKGGDPNGGEESAAAKYAQQYSQAHAAQAAPAQTGAPAAGSFF